jgi:metal-dependent amidase/aminoacylase/carboxypeptidase family protein
MLLIAAEAIVQCKHKLHGSVKLLFQPAEEDHGGAKAMIEAGCLENPKVDEVVSIIFAIGLICEQYGIHLWSYLSPGVVGVKLGPLMATCEDFSIRIKGKGGHGAAPQYGYNSILSFEN